MKKLSIALLFSIGMMGSAIAADTMKSEKQLQPNHNMNMKNDAGTKDEWQSKQWDKKKWNAMTPQQKAEYREQHKISWNKMTPEEREAMKMKMKNRKNYMSDKWHQYSGG